MPACIKSKVKEYGAVSNPGHPTPTTTTKTKQKHQIKLSS